MKNNKCNLIILFCASLYIQHFSEVNGNTKDLRFSQEIKGGLKDKLKAIKKGANQTIYVLAAFLNKPVNQLVPQELLPSWIPIEINNDDSEGIIGAIETDDHGEESANEDDINHDDEEEEQGGEEETDVIETDDHVESATEINEVTVGTCEVLKNRGVFEVSIKVPNDCHCFLHCVHGIIVRRECCPGNLVYNPINAKCDWVQNVSPLCGTTAQEICLQPKDPGEQGNLIHSMYHFDSNTGSCKEFVYGGRGGNDNRFKYKAQCERVCNSLIGSITAPSISTTLDPFPVWLSNMMNTSPGHTETSTLDPLSILLSQINNTTESAIVSSTFNPYSMWNIDNPIVQSNRKMAENESQMESLGIDKSYKAKEA